MQNPRDREPVVVARPYRWHALHRCGLQGGCNGDNERNFRFGRDSSWGPSIGQGLSDSNNALNFIRLALASAVIVAHTWPVGGFGTAPRFAGMDSGEWAVAGFFSLSGFLIAGSRLRLPFGGFLLRRALRIFPGFWACLVVVAFGFAPLSVAVGVPGSWSVGDGLRHVAVNLALQVREFNVGSTIRNNPLALAWDGSLWTLFFEFGSYLVVGALLGIALFRRRTATCFAAVIVLTTVAYYVAMSEHITSFYLVNGLNLATSFVAGVLLFAVKDRLPISRALFALSVVALAVIGFCGLPRLLVAIPFAYGLLYLGATLPTRIGTKNDVSYGVYVYAFPVQQFLAARHLQHDGKLVFMVVAFILTLPLAWLSWLLIERPGMNLRRKLGRRDSRSPSAMAAPVIPDEAADHTQLPDAAPQQTSAHTVLRGGPEPGFSPPQPPF
ncbi:acyltransferase family protein [Flexivirga alba]|uniref:Acyltransferase family protein n=1 Tax=Flexivirga alba TaxID=702742 RepID=A0ABW2AG55_9MICO